MSEEKTSRLQSTPTSAVSVTDIREPGQVPASGQVQTAFARSAPELSGRMAAPARGNTVAPADSVLCEDEFPPDTDATPLRAAQSELFAQMEQIEFEAERLYQQEQPRLRNLPHTSGQFRGSVPADMETGCVPDGSAAQYSSKAHNCHVKTQAGIKMVKETSATESTAQKAEAVAGTDTISTTATSNVTPETSVPAADSSSREIAGNNYRPAPVQGNSNVPAVPSQYAPVQVQPASGAKTGMLWVAVVVALAAAGFSGYTSFTNQQRLMNFEQKVDSAAGSLTAATTQVEQKAGLLEAAYQQNNLLNQTASTLTQQYQSLAGSINSVIAAQQQQAATVNGLSEQISVFAERNPNDWKLAESYFLVNNAAAKGIFEKDITAAVWMLTQADELLVGIEDEQVIALREAISKDITTLKNISQVDMRGLGLTLNRAYDNVDNLVLEGYSDPKTRAAAFDKTKETTADIKDWKENLLNSAKDFSLRFVEVRRRDAEAATEFLTPEQDLYLRENIKTRILLAKADLSHGDKEAMQQNLQDAIKLVTVYFDPNSTVTKNTLEMLTKVEQSEITIKTPEVLQSSKAFSEFAREHLLGRGE